MKETDYNVQIWDQYTKLWAKYELTDAEWDEIEKYRNYFFCSTPNWDLGGEYLDYVQYKECKMCHKILNPVLFMSEKVGLREQVNTLLICRMCYPEAIKHKKERDWDKIESKYKELF